MAGIEKRYILSNPELFNNWLGEIQNWGSLHRLVICLPNKDEYGSYWFKTIRSAKIFFTKEMGIKGAIWVKDNESICIQ